MQSKFMQENVEKMMQDIHSIDISSPDAQTVLNNKIAAYELQFQEQFSKLNSQQLQPSYQGSQVYAPLPQDDDQMEKIMKTTFVADGSLFGQYQNLMRQAKIPEYVPSPPPPPPVDPLAPEELHKVFIKLPQNYLEQNANSKLYLRQNAARPHSTDRLHYPVFDCNQPLFFHQQLQLMMLNPQGVVAPPPPPQDPESALKDKIKENINNLGGVEDTVGVMIKSLGDFEVANMVTRKYKGFNQNPSKFTFCPNDSVILQKQDADQMIMHQITQQLEMTKAQTMPKFHPFESVIQQSQVEQNPEVYEQSLRSIEQSRLMRQQMEQKLRKK